MEFSVVQCDLREMYFDWKAWRVAARLGCTFNKHTDCIRSLQRTQTALAQQTKKDNSTARAQHTNRVGHCLSHCAILSSLSTTPSHSFRIHCIVVRAHNAFAVSPIFIFCFLSAPFYRSVSFARVWTDETATACLFGRSLSLIRSVGLL